MSGVDFLFWAFGVPIGILIWVAVAASVVAIYKEFLS